MELKTEFSQSPTAGRLNNDILKRIVNADSQGDVTQIQLAIELTNIAIAWHQERCEEMVAYQRIGVAGELMVDCSPMYGDEYSN